MTSLISGLFCALRGSCRKYERASSLELSLVRGWGKRGGGTQPPQAHLPFARLVPRKGTGIVGARAGGGPCTGNIKTGTSLLVPQSRSPEAAMPWFSPTRSLACCWPRSTQQVKHPSNWKQWISSFGRGLKLVLEVDRSRTVFWELKQPRTQAVGDLSHHRNHTADFLFHGAYYATDPNLVSKWHIVLRSKSFPVNNFFVNLFSSLKVILVWGNFVTVFQKSGWVSLLEQCACRCWQDTPKTNSDLTKYSCSETDRHNGRVEYVIQISDKACKI